MSTGKKIFTPIQLGDVVLRNRIVMAPMTRCRAEPGDVPGALQVEYYAQRAGAGLIITEGTQPSLNGKGYCRTPGIHSEEQIQGWKNVTDAVHKKGGTIVLQVMHCGRVASHLNKAADAETVAPSAITARGQIYTEEGMQPLDQPRALALDEIPDVVDEYRKATNNALAAGFDGVELHCTSGYLPAQFLSSGANHRTDQYGGSVANRIRFVVEVLAAMAEVGGAGRVGIRICPDNPFNDLHDDNPEETFEALLNEINSLGLAYVHVIRYPLGRVDNIALAQRCFSGPLIINESYELAEAETAIASGIAAAVAFGRPFVANPDLPARFQAGTPLAEFDIKTLYTPGPVGYTDYPAANL